MQNERKVWRQNFIFGLVLFVLLVAYAWLPSKPAQAAGGGWDTNGVMALAAPSGDRLLLVDTNKMHMCMYRTLGLQLRLISARSYKYDVEIKDSAGTDIEKGDGMTYIEVKRLYDEKEKNRK
jgi:hypothetical protein